MPPACCMCTCVACMQPCGYPARPVALHVTRDECTAGDQHTQDTHNIRHAAAIVRACSERIGAKTCTPASSCMALQYRRGVGRSGTVVPPGTPGHAAFLCACIAAQHLSYHGACGSSRGDGFYRKLRWVWRSDKRKANRNKHLGSFQEVRAGRGASASWHSQPSEALSAPPPPKLWQLSRSDLFPYGACRKGLPSHP